MSTRANRSFWSFCLAGLPIRQICCGVLLCVVLNCTSATKPKVAVIGAGYAGLITARRLLKNGYIVVQYEKMVKIGGVWYLLHQHIHNGQSQINPLYQSARTNSHAEGMELPDLKFEGTAGPYPNVDEVNTYLQNYYETFLLGQPDYTLILNTEIISVNAIRDNQVGLGDNRWSLKYKHPNNPYFNLEDVYDAVFVCNGPFSQWTVPEYDGIQDFTGTNIHIHQFYDANDKRFKGKDVLVAGNPRFDNLKALGKSAKSVSLSLTQDRFGDATRSPGSYPGCSLYPEIEKFENGEFHFSNAESRKFDALIRTTSDYYFHPCPFLRESNSGIQSTQTSIEPLYRGTINIKNRNMVFIGVSLGVPYLDVQVLHAIEFLSGRRRLPSEHNMMATLRNDGLLLSNPVLYVNTLLKEAGIINTSKFLKEMGVHSCLDDVSCKTLEFCKTGNMCTPWRRVLRKMGTRFNFSSRK